MFVYIGSTNNQLGIVEVDNENGNLVREVETIDHVIDPKFVPPRRTGLFSRATATLYSPTTEWILKHPKIDLLYAFTSFLSQKIACVTTYQVDRQTGLLTKLGVCETGGLQASYATFSPDGSTLVVCHHNDGKLAFFDCTVEHNGGVLDSPLKVVETPLVREGTRSTEFPTCLPGLHHVCFAPNGKYILTVDCSTQARIWTYPVDERGLVTTDEPIYNYRVRPIQEHPSAMSNLLGTQVLNNKNRIRRVVIHPNGQYAYILLETHSLIQVFEITSQGKIVADCLQEIPSIDPSFFDKSKWRFVGMAFNAAAELVATASGVMVSNRGFVMAGKAESSVRFLAYRDNGASLESTHVVQASGPVRHFAYLDDGMKLLTGVTQVAPYTIETFARRKNGEFAKTGEAAVGLDVQCLVTLSQQPVQSGVSQV